MPDRLSVAVPETYQHGAFSVAAIPTGERWGAICYVVRDASSGEAVIVDPGGASSAIRAAVAGLGASVRGVLLTHAHHDHVGAAAEVAAHFGVRCHIHSADFKLLRKAATYSVAFGGRPFPPVTDPVALDAEGSTFAFGPLRIVHTPGHTPGSCSFFFPGFVFTGDTLLHREVGRTDLPGSDRAALVASVDEIMRLASDDDILYGGHPRPWRAGEARRWWAER